jgi:Fe(3+) dicitrate transport protein
LIIILILIIICVESIISIFGKINLYCYEDAMPKRFPFYLTVSIAVATACNAGIAAELEEVVIIGSQDAARALPGSGAVVENHQLETEVITDVNQALKTVPGVYIREEDGSGLRPNIGIRGATGERSSKITLLEDGILMAPAPYSEPAAYYFPTMMRMHTLEVLKGAPLLRYGPQTSGGVINMVSTPIPEKNTGSLTYSTGAHGSQDMHVNYGGKQDQWSWLLETVQRDSDGFKNIDRSNQDSGFAISDYVAKVGWEAKEGPEQKLLLKLQSSNEMSNETYLGLTDNDFKADPNRRYGLSSIDQMTNDHTSISLLYSRALTEMVSSSFTVYQNNFARDWFKLDSDSGGAVVDAANGGDANAQGILDGTVDTTGLKYKHNNREYVSQGVEAAFDINLNQHMLQVGARYHEDEVDRFQPTENYDQVNGSLVFQSITQPNASNNRIGESEANSLWVQDEWAITDKLTSVMSLRYEDVDSSEKRYGDIGRNFVASTRKNSVSEWLPGASFTYEITQQWQLLAGIHKGFAPVGSDAAKHIDPETSINWEMGARFLGNNVFAEAIAFYSDFSDKVENCSVGTPCSNGATSGSFATGEAVISGMEMQIGTEFTSGNVTIPLAVAYTYTDARLTRDNTVSGLEDGDVLKDVPENIFSARAGFESGTGWNNYLVAKYIDASCVAIGCNRNTSPQAETDSLFVIDLISRLKLHEKAEVFFKVENLLDEQQIVSRDPDGARPNKPLTTSVGVKLDF